MRNRRTTLLIALLSLGLPLALMLEGCRTKDTGHGDPGPSNPTTYNFSNVSYKDEADRVKMLDEMLGYIEDATNNGTALDAAKLKDMLRNQGNRFSFTSSVSLLDKFSSSDTLYILSILDSAAKASQSGKPAANGQAGVAANGNGKKYLLGAKGSDWLEVVEKEVMGAVFYYNGVDKLLRDDQIGATVDNTNAMAGQGTPRQHHWDEAFGYLGVPKTFPDSADQALFWGEYTNARDAILKTNAKLMNAFIAGRVAINNNDTAGVTAQTRIIRDTWELVSAASAISYLNAAMATSDAVARNHELTEAMGFIRALRYKHDTRFSATSVSQAILLIGTNYYNVEQAKLTQVRDMIADAYGIDSGTRQSL